MGVDAARNVQADMDKAIVELVLEAEQKPDQGGNHANQIDWRSIATAMTRRFQGSQMDANSAKDRFNNVKSAAKAIFIWTKDQTGGGPDFWSLPETDEKDEAGAVVLEGRWNALGKKVRKIDEAVYKEMEPHCLQDSGVNPASQTSLGASNSTKYAAEVAAIQEQLQAGLGEDDLDDRCLYRCFVTPCDKAAVQAPVITGICWPRSESDVCAIHSTDYLGNTRGVSSTTPTC